jgi:hypothetical protein
MWTDHSAARVITSRRSWPLDLARATAPAWVPTGWLWAVRAAAAAELSEVRRRREEAVATASEERVRAPITWAGGGARGTRAGRGTSEPGRRG